MGFIRKMWDGFARFFTGKPGAFGQEARREFAEPEAVTVSPKKRHWDRLSVLRLPYPKKHVAAGAFGRNACRMRLADVRRRCRG